VSFEHVVVFGIPLSKTQREEVGRCWCSRYEEICFALQRTTQAQFLCNQLNVIEKKRYFLKKDGPP